MTSLYPRYEKGDGMVVRMNSKFYGELTRYCRSKLPEEACGFINGCPIEDGFLATQFLPVTNNALNPQEHFTMNPPEIVPILYKKEPSLQQIIGIFHSHPSTEAVISQEDGFTQWHTLPTYWIFSYQHPSAPVLQIFNIKKADQTRFNKLSFVIDQ
jgi:[CysO sulfur-carrier protein]-S-L-cysteine hydrolase